MPTSSQALILIKTDSGRLSNFYKTRITPDITPFPLSKVNLTGEVASRATSTTRSGVMVHSHHDTFQPTKALEGLTVNGYRGVLSFDPVLKSFRWQLLPDPTDHKLNRPRTHQRSASAPNIEDTDHVQEEVVLTHLDDPSDQTSDQSMDNTYRRLLDLGFRTSSFRGLDSPTSPEPWDHRRSVTPRPGSSRPRTPRQCLNSERHKSAPDVGMTLHQTRNETGDNLTGLNITEGVKWYFFPRPPLTEARPPIYSDSIQSDNPHSRVPDVQITSPSASGTDAVVSDIPFHDDGMSISAINANRSQTCGTKSHQHVTNGTKPRPHSNDGGVARQQRFSTEKPPEFLADKPNLQSHRAWELSLRGGDKPSHGYRSSWKPDSSSIPEPRLSSASRRYHVTLPLPPIPESLRHLARSRSRRTKLDRSERQLDPGLSPSQEKALYEEAKVINKRKKKLPAIRMRRELPPPSPHALCFCLKNRRSYDHEEIKAIIEEQINTPIGSLLFDPVFLHLGVENTEGACLWVFTLADDALRMLLIHQGLNIEGDRVRVRRYDDVLYDEHEAYRFYRDVTEEQRRRHLTSQRRSSHQKSMGSAVKMEKHVAFT